MKPGAGINTLDPQSAEVTLPGLAISVLVHETFFDRIFGYGPHILLPAKETLGKFEHPFAPGAGCHMID